MLLCGMSPPRQREVAGRGQQGIWGWGFTTAAPPTPQVQCFDPKEDRWSLRAPAPFSQRCLEAVSIEDTIYVVGGLMSRIFTYDPSTDVWEEAAVLPSPVVSGRSWAWALALVPFRTVETRFLGSGSWR